MTAKRKQSKSKKTPPEPPLLLRYLRGLLGLAFVVLALGFFGSYIMRVKVIQQLRNQAITSASVVLSRPFALARGIPLEQTRFAARTKRLGYRMVQSSPQRPGQYSIAGNEVLIFLRHSRINPQHEQREQLVRLTLDEQGMIEDIFDVKFNQQLELAWLEPELLSLLGHTSSRAVTPKEIEEFSPLLVQAVLAIEDERFYSHFGLDPWAIIRAAAINLRAGKIVQGGSTITQQLAKNLFLGTERTFARKAMEAGSALLIETAFSKEQILEFYLNEVFLGQEGRIAIHGFGEAARTFFDKDAAELSLAEAATLAGIIKAPSSYSPRRYPQRAKTRRNIVLRKMLALSKISEEDFKKAFRTKLEVRAVQRTRRRAPYFIDYVSRELTAVLEHKNLNASALRVHSGLDVEFQQCAETALSTGLKTLEKRYSRLAKASPPAQAGLIAVSPNTGEILAWVGGRNYGKNQFDRISQAKRQPGSAFKPFVYLTALDRHLNTYRVARTTSLLLDRPLKLDIPGSTTWSPQNYDKKFRGEVTLRQALAKSLNVPTVNLALKVGIKNIARTAELFGFGENLPQVPSLALGAGEVSPLEMARAYAALANGGILLDLRPILWVTEHKQEQVVFQSDLDERRVVSEPAVFVLTNILQSVIEHGTGRGVRRLGFTLPAAGKTGTSNDERDSWFAGFTPRILAIVWVGFDDNRKLGLTGAGAAAPIWTEFMKCATQMEPKLDFVPPPGVVYRKIDTATGLLAVDGCPKQNVVTELYVKGTEPLSECPIHTRRRRYGESESEYQRRKTPRKRGKSIWEKLFQW